MTGEDFRVENGSTARPEGREDLPPRVFDTSRLAAVRDSGLVDSPPEAAFDDLAALAASIAGVSRAFITVLDDKRSYWKSAIGMGELPPGERHNVARESPCHLIVGDGRPLIVDDAARDPRLAGVGAVADLGIGAWAGYPIHSESGHVLGALCVVDDHSRAWTAEQRQGLAVLARSVTNEISLRTAVRRMSAQMRDLEGAEQRSAALARTLQESLLPPRLAVPPGLQAAARYLPAGRGATVLGDFYDLFPIGGSRWCAVLGDVVGHGLEAAKVTALARYTLRADAARNISPAYVLNQLNTALLAQDVAAEQYLTAVCAIFRAESTGDGASGITGTLSTAGHPSALLRHDDGRVEEIRSSGAILGLFPNAAVSHTRFTLKPGQTLLLHTDGVTEAHPPSDMRLYGEQRLHETLAACHDLDAAAIVERIGAEVMDHCRHDPPDDIALLALRVPPQT